MKVIYKHTSSQWIDKSGNPASREESHAYCPQCGSLADRGFPFCPYCGSELQYDDKTEVGVKDRTVRCYSDRMYVITPIQKRNRNSKKSREVKI